MVKSALLSWVSVSVADTDYKYPVFSSQTKQKGLMGFYKKYLFCLQSNKCMFYKQ